MLRSGWPPEQHTVGPSQGPSVEVFNVHHCARADNPAADGLVDQIVKKAEALRLEEEARWLFPEQGADDYDQPMSGHQSRQTQLRIQNFSARSRLESPG